MERQVNTVFQLITGLSFSLILKVSQIIYINKCQNVLNVHHV